MPKNQTVSARVLAAFQLNGQKYNPNDVIHELPDEVSSAYGDFLDPHHDAVKHAIETGGKEYAYGKDGQ